MLKIRLYIELWPVFTMATVRLDQKSRAIVRSISDSYVNALAKYFGSGPSNIEVARHQHNAYIDALESNGVEVTTVSYTHQKLQPIYSV